MGAECHDCGTDLVYAEWPGMECPVCTVRADRDRYREALEQIRDGIFSGNQAAQWARAALREGDTDVR